jgi:hypothetical protein
MFGGRKMARAIDAATTGLIPATSASTTPSQAAQQAYQILHLGFTVAPILAGADKFFHWLTNWDQYLAPFINNLLGGHGHEFMLAVGAIEVVAGIGVAWKPRIFGYVVAAWLLGITVNLLLTGQYFDIALRDFGLALGALALARLSQDFGR